VEDRGRSVREQQTKNKEENYRERGKEEICWGRKRGRKEDGREEVEREAK